MAALLPYLQTVTEQTAALGDETERVRDVTRETIALGPLPGTTGHGPGEAVPRESLMTQLRRAQRGT